MEQLEIEVVAEARAGKCPYLAGRPPHGTYKLWPSSINVCYGRPQEDRAYGRVGKETQARHCFSSEAVFCQCAHYQRAREAGLAAPEFARVMKGEEEPAAPVRRVRRTRRKKRHQPSGLLPLVRTVVFLAMLIAAVVVATLVLMK